MSLFNHDPKTFSFMTPEDSVKPAKTPRGSVGQPPLAYYQRAMARYLDRTVQQSQLISDALKFSYKHHLGYFRKSGEPYFNHPMAVAEILIRDFKINDPELLAAAFLHDLVEDVPAVTLLDLEANFGKTVAELVDGCTKLSLQRFDRATQSDLTHSKIFVSASRHLGVLIIKLADRLHNMRTLGSLPISKRRRIAQETLKIYAPLAAKLNLFPIKRHLYNLALTHLFPRKSKKILNVVRGLRNSPEIEEINKRLESVFSSMSKAVQIRPRVKGLGPYYSHERQTLDLKNAENTVDFTIVIDSPDPVVCYTGLGIINNAFTPVPKSIRDYIANQKPNGYQSLHVRINNKGNDYLIKLRIKSMDMKANSGMTYALNSKNPIYETYLEELSDMLKNIGEYGGAGAQRKDLIQLSSGEEMFVFTPKGDIHYLPRGSIVLDFAYKIHSALGDYCGGAQVNGIRVGLTEELKDRDTVKIISSYEPMDVDPALEKNCVTPKARSAVNKLLQKKRQIVAEKIGKDILLQEIQRHNLPASCLEDESVSLVLNFLHIKDLAAFFTRIGQDTLSSKVILYYLDHLRSSSPTNQKKPMSSDSEHPSDDQNILRVSELEKAVHKFSKCCNPYPGQEDVLAALSERGVAFHRKNCANLNTSPKLKKHKMLRVEWQTSLAWSFPIVFELIVTGSGIMDTISRISAIAPETRLHGLKRMVGKRVDAQTTSVSVTLSSFQEANAFFKTFKEGSVAVNTYGREKTNL
jgi:GTP diphosphokinase / guanosine-3',5'-bis(diphosphate) 3'-diphosphatase